MPSRYLVALFCLTSLSAQTSLKVIDTYCSGCHNGSMRSPSGVLLDQFDAGHISASPDAWARVYRQLQAGTMPPVGAPRPDRATYDAALISIEHALGADTKPAAVADGKEIATRLATILWNSAPDAALLKDTQRLTDSATLERQIRRMLADDRAQAFVAGFFKSWLQLERLGKFDPESKFSDAALRDSFIQETELFVLSQLRDDRDPIELWSANYTFVNERLAKQYGIPNVSGPEFRRVSYTTPERARLLGQGSLLMLTSSIVGDNAFTSPAARGVWIRKHFLGVPPPNAFPNAQPVKPELPITPQTRVLPSDPCVTCHRNFFPLGYALEHFDALGRWRTLDQIGSVDASGSFVDGTSTNGVVELRQVLLQRPEAFRTAITEQLLLYVATGKAAPSHETPGSLIRARQILGGTKKVTWSALIAAIVRAPLEKE